jgi:hypothetical protein
MVEIRNEFLQGLVPVSTPEERLSPIVSMTEERLNSIVSVPG